MYELLNLQLPSPVTQIHDDLLEQKNLQLFIKRDDLIHPLLQGNKFRKLKYNLLNARSQQLDTLLTFGGAYSNHIHATAAAGHLLGFKTIGIIRGEETLPLNPTLEDATRWGMKIDYVSRADYREKDSPHFIAQLKNKYEAFYLIPEGGSNTLALKGCAGITSELDSNYDVICTACGTGSTMAGLILGANENCTILGYSILNSQGHMKKAINQHLDINNADHTCHWEVITDYHFGGYAKTDNQLINFINRFQKQHQIQLEPVYTGKMLYGLFEQIKKNYFEPGTKILAIHTGGLQGLRGFGL